MKENNFNSDENLKNTMRDIQKMFGAGSVMLLGEKTDICDDIIPSGSLCLDYALGIGGYPKGRIIEIFGPESSGKTTVALHAIAECQKLGGKAAFIDAEQAIDPQYARNLGVNIDELILSQPDSGEQALEITDMLIKSNAIDLVVVDSVAALVPQAELEGEMIDSQMGLQARLMSKGLRKIAANLNKTNCTIIFINQLREKIGVMYGNPETTTGGRALKFYSTIRIEVRRADAIKNGSDIVGNNVHLKIVKNKVAPPFKQADVTIVYGQGVSRMEEVIDLSVHFGIVNKAGSWYSYGENKIGQGKEAVKNFFKENIDIYNEIYDKVKSCLFNRQ